MANQTANQTNQTANLPETANPFAGILPADAKTYDVKVVVNERETVKAEELFSALADALATKGARVVIGDLVIVNAGGRGETWIKASMGGASASIPWAASRTMTTSAALGMALGNLSRDLRAFGL